MNVVETLKQLGFYSMKGKFYFNQKSVLKEVCNIPRNNNISGVYLFFDDLTNELLYVGISGKVGNLGEFNHRKDGLLGRFMKGKQFGDLRKRSLSLKMKEDGIQMLRIQWYVTYANGVFDIPRDIEISLLKAFKLEYARLPKWNKRN
ncbi:MULTISPECIES: hypothetical protein [unclassified Sphingobacterium]|uniref:hypothetical protein n=1 Tax=unclassified Sphingobacterium TaxID=2609468 RepID=UPI0025DF5408|nr:MULTISPECIES: hypothetical protein [unclassified Sphingobacterium]